MTGNALWPRGCEIIQYTKDIAQASGGLIRYETAGFTLRATPMPMAIIGYPHAPQHPDEVGDRPVLWFLGSMHGGEPSGAEAALWFLREVAEGRHNDMLRNVVVFVFPAFNVDGRNDNYRNVVTGGFSSDPNRDLSKMSLHNTRALFRHMRRWGAHMLMDMHHYGGNDVRHIQSFNVGRSTNAEPEIYAFGQVFQDQVFGAGVGEFGRFIAGQPGVTNEANANANRFVRHMRWLREHATEPLLQRANVRYVEFNQYVPDFAFPYLLDNSYVFINTPPHSDTDRGIGRVVHVNNDNARTTLGYFSNLGRIGILTEVPNNDATPWAQAHAQYASIISAVDIANRRAGEIVSFFKEKDTELVGRASTDGVEPLSLGRLDLRAAVGPTRGPNAGNWSFNPSPNAVRNMRDFGWGDGYFEIQGWRLSGTGATAVRNRGHGETRAHRAHIWNTNVADPRPHWLRETGSEDSPFTAPFSQVTQSEWPRFPVSIRTFQGAFYIFDGNAHRAAEGLMRHGVQVSRLTRDVVMPGGAYVFSNPGRLDGYWGVAWHHGRYPNLVGTGHYMGHNVLRVEIGGWNFEDFHIAREGSYVFSTAQPFGRFGAYWIEPQAVCGAFIWNFFDDVLSVKNETFSQARPRGPWDDPPTGIANITITGLTPARVDIAKTRSFLAIPANALEPLYLPEDVNRFKKPESLFIPPFLHLDGDFTNMPGVPRLESATQSTNGNVTLTIRDAMLHSGQWLSFFFYNVANVANANEFVGVLGQVSAVAPGVYEVFFSYNELLEAGLEIGQQYSIHYSNDWGDIFGHGTTTQGALTFNRADVEPTPTPTPTPTPGGGGSSGCNAGFFGLALLAAVPFIFRRK